MHNNLEVHWPDQARIQTGQTGFHECFGFFFFRGTSEFKDRNYESPF